MKKTQGEIFGIALLFVVLILGIIIYAKIQSQNPDNQKNLLKDGKNKILAESTLNTILKLSTGCFTERNRDRVIDLIQYCLYNQNSQFDKINLICSKGKNKGSSVDACKYPIEIINNTLYAMFNNSKNYMIPFYLNIELPAYSKTSLSNVNITNFNDFTFRNKKINKKNYLRNGFNKAPSGLISIPTSYRNIDFSLAIYYR